VRESLADDHDGVVFGRPESLNSRPARMGRRARQKIRGDDTHLRARVFIGDMHMAIGGELHTETEAASRQGAAMPKEVVSRPAAHRRDESIPCRNRGLAEAFFP